MESIVIDIKTENDKILLSALASRLHLKSVILSEEEKEDIGLLNAMKEAKKSGKTSEKKVMQALNKWL
jgi:hypothetical protein